MIGDIIVIGLGAWLMASLLVDQDGPGQVFAHLRRLVGVRPNEVQSGLPALFSCVWCMSCWTAPAVYLVWEYVADWPVQVAAVAAVAIMVEQYQAR